MHIVIEDEQKQIRTAAFGQELSCIVVGSQPECHVYLPDTRVAEEHFHLRYDTDQRRWRLHFCPFPAGTSAEYTRVFVNALDAQDELELKQNDEIMISRFRLRLYLEDVSGDAPRAAILEEAARIRAHPLPPGAIVRPGLPDELLVRAAAGPQLAAFAFAIHDCADLAALLSRILQEVMHLFKARQVWLGGRRHNYGRLEFVDTLYADGRTSGEPPLLETYQYRCLERGQYICAVQTGEEGTESAMCVPLPSDRGLLGILYVDNKPGAGAYEAIDLDLLAILGLLIGRQLELIIEGQLKLQEAVTAGEFSFVRELQARMDPRNVPQWSGLQLAAYCKPGLDTAGDTYDVMRLPNELASFICGHVSGSATRVAVAMAEIRAAFRMAGLHADPPHVILRAMNWMLYDEKSPCSFAGCGVIMNPRTGAAQYSTAGNAGAVIIGQRGAVRNLAQASVPEVGQTRNHNYQSLSGRLMEGETLILYTQGCLRAMNPAGLALGEDRFLEAASDGFGQPASATLDELLSDLKGFFREGRCPDDMTIMVVHRE